MLGKLRSIFGLHCPACRTGNLFPGKNKFWNYRFEMNNRCPVCNESFFREPGFYYGAMFISYIFSGFFSLFFVGTLILFLDVPWDIALVILFFVLGLSFGYLFKVSRSIWIHFFVKYNKEKL